MRDGRSLCLYGRRAGEGPWRELAPGYRVPADAPLHRDASGVSVLWTGRLFNHAPLAQAAGLPASAADGEIVAALWKSRGARLLDDLVGYFAFVVVDPDGPRVFAAQDRSDMERLYYARHGDELVVIATDVRDVTRVVGARVDAASLPEYFTFGQLGGAATMFRDVRRLDTHDTLTADGGGFRVDRSAYTALVTQPTEPRLPLDAALDRFASGIEAALRSASAGEADVVNTLSGGADSSYLQCVLRDLGHRRSWSVAVAGAEEHHEYALEVSRALGGEHRSLTITGDELFLAMDDGIRRTGFPGLFGGEAASLVLYERLRAESGGPICLVGGDHADKVLGDGLPMLALRLYELPVPHGLLDAAIGATRLGRRHPGYRQLSVAVRRGEADLDILLRLAGDGERTRRVSALLGRDATAAAWHERIRIGADIAGSLAQKIWGIRLLTSDARVRILWLKNQLAGDFGVRLLEPFADPELVRTMWTVPNRLRFRRMTEKYIEKHLLLRRLPKRVVMRAKISNLTPFDVLERTSPRFRRLLAALADASWPELPGSRDYAAWTIERARKQNVVDGDLLYLANFHSWHAQMIRGVRDPL